MKLMAIIRIMKTYSRYIFIALALYFQNIAFSLVSNFVFIPSFLEFLAVLSLVIIISRYRFHKYIFSFWIFLYFIHFSFISYFGVTITVNDIYLFFTHSIESFETFFYTLDIYFTPFIISIFSLLIVLSIKVNTVVKNIYFLTFILIFWLLVSSIKIGDASFLLLRATYETSSLNLKTQVPKVDADSPKAFKKGEFNIVLVIGESMRAREFQERDYEMFEQGFYKTIYSGATSTDVSVPLLLNGASRASKIDLSNNLFHLAKLNGYETYFISTQSKKSMQYIEPYMMKKSISHYDILGSREDSDLIEELKKIDFNDSDTEFVVMQMQGQHSPYKYYPTYIKSTIPQQYAASMKYSNALILEMMNYVKSLKTATLFIFTSDHGELLGESGRVGHNKFHEKIYRVPMIIASNVNTVFDYEKILLHSGVYNLIYYFLGYAKEYKEEKKPIRINGSMISEEDGFRMMESN